MKIANVCQCFCLFISDQVTSRLVFFLTYVMVLPDTPKAGMTALGTTLTCLASKDLCCHETHGM